jgi:hypothetical protein
MPPTKPREVHHPGRAGRKEKVVLNALIAAGYLLLAIAYALKTAIGD